MTVHSISPRHALTNRPSVIVCQGYKCSLMYNLVICHLKEYDFVYNSDYTYYTTFKLKVRSPFSIQNILDLNSAGAATAPFTQLLHAIRFLGPPLVYITGETVSLNVTGNNVRYFTVCGIAPDLSKLITFLILSTWSNPGPPHMSLGCTRIIGVVLGLVRVQCNDVTFAVH